MKFSNLDQMFQNKGMKMNENEWNVSNLIWEQHDGNRMESFYDNITIRLLFKNKELNIQGYFGSLLKKH